MHEPAPPNAEDPAKSPFRVTDTLTTMAIGATVLAVLIAAVPVAFRATGVLRTSVVAPEVELVPLGENDDPHAIRFDKSASGVRAPADPDEDVSVRVARALRETRMLDNPAADAHVVGTIASGDVVRVVQEEGAYCLVLTLEGAPAMGWVKTSDFAVR